MKIGKLCLAAFLGAMPAMASAQVSVGVNVGVNVSDDYDTVAPGDPVESVDVFYDQLSPYGTWVDEPDVGRVFVPDSSDYVPYSNGHWQYTNLGFVWVSSEPHAWATAHYGRWAYSRNYGRWYWAPDTEWGPAWVEWRQTGSDFGWAPLPPAVVVRAGWQPPVESWHYCGAAHVLDVDVYRHYEPRARVVEIHREARPIEHYTTVSNVKVVVGPHADTLREHRVAVRPVKVEARAVGRWSPTEARAQVTRAHEHQATFEAQNQHRIESNAQIRAAHVKVIEAHPQIRAQVTARVQTRAPEPNRGEPGRAAPNRPEPNRGEPARVVPNRAAPNRPAEPNRGEPNRATPNRPEPARVVPNRQEPNRPEQNRPEPARKAPEPAHVAPKPPEHAAPPVPKPAEHAAPAPKPPEQAPREPARPAPERAAPRPPEHAPAPAEHAPARPAPAPRAERKEPERKEPDRKEPEHH